MNRYTWRTDELLCLQNDDLTLSIQSHIFWCFILFVVVCVYLVVPVCIGIFSSWSHALGYWAILGAITLLGLFTFFTDGEI